MIYDVMNRWTPDEDRVIAKVMQNQEGLTRKAKFRLIHDQLVSRSLDAIEVRWYKLRKCDNIAPTASRYRIPWTESEDEILKAIYHANPKLKQRTRFEMVSAKLKTRSVRACRERFLDIVDVEPPHRGKEGLQAMDSDNRPPLVKLLYLLNDARSSEHMWNDLFPRAVEAAEAVHKDIVECRGHLEKVEPIYQEHVKLEEAKMVGKMDEIEAALQRERLVDRELKWGASK